MSIYFRLACLRTEILHGKLSHFELCCPISRVAEQTLACTGEKTVNENPSLDYGPKIQLQLRNIASIGEKLEKVNLNHFAESKGELFRAFASLILAYNEVIGKRFEIAGNLCTNTI